MLAFVLDPALLDSKSKLLKIVCLTAFLVMIKIWPPIFRWWHSVRDGRACVRTYWLIGSGDRNPGSLGENYSLYMSKGYTDGANYSLGKCISQECSLLITEKSWLHFSPNLRYCWIYIVWFSNRECEQKKHWIYTDLLNPLKVPLFSLKQALSGCHISSCLNVVVWEVLCKTGYNIMQYRTMQYNII